jgi:hypothetical protein|tara:strand:- start:1632 stop:2102 length:471 start_codon:yes stop_codon:yes gene_type:complete
MAVLLKAKRKRSGRTYARNWGARNSKRATKTTAAPRESLKVGVKPRENKLDNTGNTGVRTPLSRIKKPVEFFPEEEGIARKVHVKPPARQQDAHPWESPFWPKDSCSRHLGNQDCQCGKPPTYPKPWEGADAYLPGCPKSDDDIGQVVSEESGRFG